MKNLNECVDRLFANKSLTNLIVKVGIGDSTVCELIRTAEDRDLNSRTIFDMASVTKMISTTSLALIAIDRGLLSTDDSLSKFFDAPRAKELTVSALGRERIRAICLAASSSGLMIMERPSCWRR